MTLPEGVTGDTEEDGNFGAETRLRLSTEIHRALHGTARSLGQSNMVKGVS